MNLCERVIDESNNLVCGEAALNTVKIQGRSGPVLVYMCNKHLAEHNETFARLRTGNKR